MNMLTTYSQTTGITVFSALQGIMPAPVSMNTYKPDVDLLQTLFRQSEQHSALLRSFPYEVLNSDAKKFLGLSSELVREFDATTGAQIKASYVNNAETALGHMNKHYWTTLLKESKVSMLMPTQRKEKFLSQEASQFPEFSAANVAPLIQDFLSMQDFFFAERVDYVFKALSDEHVTNSGAGFTGKMILEPSTANAAFDELRMLIACLIGRVNRMDAVEYASGAGSFISRLRAVGPYNTPIDIDHGLMSVRVFKKGTVHITIHDDIATKLNMILNALYPSALPKTVKPNAQSTWTAPVTVERCLPAYIISAVVTVLNKRTSFAKNKLRELTMARPELTSLLGECKSDCSYVGLKNMGLETLSIDPLFQSVLKSLGGKTIDNSSWVFEYDTKLIAATFAMNGFYADQKDFQFYPTTPKLSSMVAEFVCAQHQEGLTYLEPSIGHADLIGHMDFISVSAVTGVELSVLNAEISRAKGFSVVQADFIAWAATTHERFDRIVMNPPFAHGQALAHVKAAQSVLRSNGIIFAILPATLIHEVKCLGHVVTSEIYSGMFEDASVNVFIAQIR